MLTVSFRGVPSLSLMGVSPRMLGSKMVLIALKKPRPTIDLYYGESAFGP